VTGGSDFVSFYVNEKLKEPLDFRGGSGGKCLLVLACGRL